MSSSLISVTGPLCNDIIITLNDFPPIGESRHIIERKNFFGGNAANVAVGIAKLGGNAELLTAVGIDFPSSPYEEYLSHLNIKTHFYHSKTQNCSTAYMINDISNNQVTYFESGAEEVYLHIDPPHRAFIHMATGNANYNIKVAKNSDFASLDPGQDVKYYTKDNLETLFEHIDLLICNQFELSIMENTTGHSKSDIINTFPTTIITKGSTGSTLYTDGKKETIPAVPVNAVDPTGAGDAYRAGLFTALKKGYDMEICCKVGAVVASFDVEKVGAQTNLPDWKTMVKRYTENFGNFPSQE